MSLSIWLEFCIKVATYFDKYIQKGTPQRLILGSLPFGLLIAGVFWAFTLPVDKKETRNIQEENNKQNIFSHSILKEGSSIHIGEINQIRNQVINNNSIPAPKPVLIASKEKIKQSIVKENISIRTGEINKVQNRVINNNSMPTPKAILKAPIPYQQNALNQTFQDLLKKGINQISRSQLSDLLAQGNRDQVDPAFEPLNINSVKEALEEKITTGEVKIQGDNLLLFPGVNPSKSN